MAKITLSRRTKGILCILLAALGFSGMSACARLAGPDIPTVQKAFFRNFVALLAAIALTRSQGVAWKPARKNIPALVGRSVFGTLGLLLNFYAIDRLALADANMLNKLSPFFAILFSAWLLREKPNGVQLGAVGVAFLGSLCIMKPGFQDTPFLPALAGFFGGMGAGIAYTAVRALGKRGERGPFIVFFFSTFFFATFSPAVMPQRLISSTTSPRYCRPFFISVSSAFVSVSRYFSSSEHQLAIHHSHSFMKRTNGA